MGRHRLLNLGDMSGEYEQALIERFPEIPGRYSQMRPSWQSL